MHSALAELIEVDTEPEPSFQLDIQPSDRRNWEERGSAVALCLASSGPAEGVRRATVHENMTPLEPADSVE